MPSPLRSHSSSPSTFRHRSKGLKIGWGEAANSRKCEEEEQKLHPEPEARSLAKRKLNMLLTSPSKGGRYQNPRGHLFWQIGPLHCESLQATLGQGFSGTISETCGPLPVVPGEIDPGFGGTVCKNPPMSLPKTPQTSHTSTGTSSEDPLPASVGTSASFAASSSIWWSARGRPSVKYLPQRGQEVPFLGCLEPFGRLVHRFWRGWV